MITRSVPVFSPRRFSRPTVGSAGSLALTCGLSLATLAGCAEPMIVDFNADLGTHMNGDGGDTTVTSHWTASPATAASIQAQDNSGGNPDYRQSKRDPYYLVDGSTQYLFYAGGIPDPVTEEWSIAYYTAQSGTAITTATAAMQAFRRRAGKWDGASVSAPSVRASATTQPKWTMWYAGDGDPSKPDYVQQIGVATSSDLTNWTRSDTPALAVPAYTGSTATDTPQMARADAYGVTDPCVITDGSGNLVLYYAGLDCSNGPCQYQIFRSVSTTGGMTFPPGSVVLKARGGIAEEAGGVAGPSVIFRNNQYVMAYTAVGAAPVKTRVGIRKALTAGSMGIATSTDGSNFVYAGTNTNTLISKSQGSYRADGAAAPSLYIENTNVKMYFGALVDLGVNGIYFSLATADLAESK